MLSLILIVFTNAISLDTARLYTLYYICYIGASAYNINNTYTLVSNAHDKQTTYNEMLLGERFGFLVKYQIQSHPIMCIH